MSKKLSWAFLVSFFTYDAVYSYYAITRLGAKEANWTIAPLVEKYPLLYFLCIPALILIMFIVVKLLVLGLTKISIFKNINKERMEKAILGSMVIYWIIANSSLNIAFMFGIRGLGRVWYLTTLLGIFLGLIYFAMMLKKIESIDSKVNKNLSSN